MIKTRLTATILMALLVVSLVFVASAAAAQTRTVPSGCINSGDEFTVTINSPGTGGVVETLCSGWTYTGSSLSANQVDYTGNVVTFTLVSDTSFTYTVEAPDTPDTCCTISGFFRDLEAVNHQIDDDAVYTCSDLGYCLHLDEGWNFVSVPKRINGTNNATTIFNLDPANETCEYYNASAGSWMNPADIDVVPCQGYWVWKVSEETLYIDFLSTGAITPPMQQLCMGWNMIGHIDTSVTPIDDGTIADFGSMANIEGKFLQIWQWTQDDGWERCYPYPPGLNYMTPGQGYWIWMAEDSPMSGTP